jgi:Spy/CpxP family protein refolding chaperone
MKRTHTILAGLIIAAGISGIAIAQTGPQAPGGWGCNGMGPMAGQGMQYGPGGQMGPKGMRASMRIDPAQGAERRLEFFKGELKLTPEQEPLWQAFAEKAKAQFNNGVKGYKAMRDQAAEANLTAPERMAKMQKLMQERVDAMAGVHESFNRLYGALTPEQKKIADQYPGGMGQRMGPRSGRTASQG